MDEKDKRIKELEKLLFKALARIEELERRLGLNSSISHKPPSSDGLGKKPTPQSLRSKSEKPSGGQKGHKGVTLMQIAEPHHVTKHQVMTCGACQKSLETTPVASYLKRQVFDIPEPKIEVTEDQAEVKVCSCGHKTTASFPDDVRAPVQYGPRVKALAVYLGYQQMIPEDRLENVFLDVFHLPIATSTLTSFHKAFGVKAQPIQEVVLHIVKQAPVKHLDETSLRIGGKTRWLHVMSTGKQTHYRVSEKRGNLLDDVRGTVVHDHWKPYFKMENVRHALCNAHHLRELKALQEIEKEPWAFEMANVLPIFNHPGKPCLKKAEASYDKIVEEGVRYHEAQPPLSQRKNKSRPGHNLVLRLRDFKEDVLRFLTDEDVPFTNNQAEQDIRMMKVKMKISGCFRTFQGADLFCVIKGFLSTAQKQQQNLFQAIYAAIAA